MSPLVGHKQGQSILFGSLLALAVLGAVLDWDWASGTCIASVAAGAGWLFSFSSKSAAWRKAKQPPRRQHHQAQVHQEQQEQRQQEGFALASPCGRSLAGSDISRSSDVFSLFLASNSPRSSLSCMRAQASKDSKLNYVPQTRRTQVAIKLHHSTHSITPERLSENAITDLCAQVQSSVPNAVVLNAAIRQGCVAIAFDMCRPAVAEQHFDGEGGVPAHALSQDGTELAELVQRAAMAWVQQMGMSGQLEHGTCVAVQVGTTLLKCVWDEGSQTWGVEGREDLTDLRSCRLDVASRVLLLSAPPASHDAATPGGAAEPTEQAQQQLLLPGQVQEQQEGPAVQLTFHASVRAPMSGHVVGWQGSETTHLQGSQAQLQLLARVRGRFLAVQVQQLGHEESEEGGGMHTHLVQVQVCVPPEIAHSSMCYRLQLELLFQGRLACSQALLLMPGHLSALAAEVQSLAVSEDPQQAQTYVSDLIDWLQLQGIASAVAVCIQAYEATHGVTRSGRLMREDSAMETDADVSLANLGPMLNVLSPRGGWGGSEAAVSAEAARPEATHMLVQNGQELLNCAVAWGLPAIAEQLLQGLMHAPCNLHFRTLAAALDAPREEAEGNSIIAGAFQGCSGVGLNLLGLAIMSGSPTMLSKVLGWGHAYGGHGFCWCKGAGWAAADDERAHLSSAEGWSEAGRRATDLPSSSDSKPCSVGEALQWLEIGEGGDPSAAPGGGAAGAPSVPAAAAAAAAAAVLEEAQGEEGLLSLVQALPLEDPCLQMLLADPVEGPVVSEALERLIPATRLAGGDAASSPRQSGGGGGHGATSTQAPVLSATTSHVTVRGRISGSKAAGMCSALLRVLVRWGLACRVGGGSNSRAVRIGRASSVAAAYEPAHAAAPASSLQQQQQQPQQQQRRKAMHFLWEGIQGTFQGFEAGSSSSSCNVNEADFREWCHGSNRRWAAGCCWTIMSCVAVAVVKSITHDRVSTDVPVLLLYGTPYLFVLNANKHAPQKRKIWMRTTKLCRLLSMVLMGLRITPVPVAICSLVEKHLEFITDLLIHRVADQVQLKALLLDRMTSTTAFFFLYSALDLDHPFLRSLGLNLCSLCVGLILEARNRIIYLRLKNARAKSK